MPARILIVDDEPELRDILSESLTGRGYVTETAASPRSGNSGPTWSSSI